MVLYGSIVHFKDVLCTGSVPCPLHGIPKIILPVKYSVEIVLEKSNLQTKVGVIEFSRALKFSMI